MEFKKPAVPPLLSVCQGLPFYSDYRNFLPPATPDEEASGDRCHCGMATF